MDKSSEEIRNYDQRAGMFQIKDLYSYGGNKMSTPTVGIRRGNVTWLTLTGLLTAMNVVLSLSNAMTIIHTDRAPAAIGPYSQGIVIGTFIFTSGQIPIDPHSGVIESKGIEEQTEQAIQNIQAVLEAVGSDLRHVIKTTCFLQHMSDFAAFNAVYEKHFPGKPARSCVEVAALPKGALVEIEAVAVMIDA